MDGVVIKVMMSPLKKTILRYLERVTLFTPYKNDLGIFNMREFTCFLFIGGYFIYYFDYYNFHWLETLKDVFQDLKTLGSALQAKKLDHGEAYKHIPDIIDK